MLLQPLVLLVLLAVHCNSIPESTRRDSCSATIEGSSCATSCDSSRNATCQWYKCVCTGGTCAVNGKCVAPTAPTTAPTTVGGTAAPTAAPVCKDRNVTWNGVPWLGSNQKFPLSSVTCAELRPADTMLEEISEDIRSVASQVIKVQSVSATVGAGLGGRDGLALALVAEALKLTRVFNKLYNKCNKVGINQFQDAYLKSSMGRILHPGYEALSAEEACCACGGGTTSLQALNQITRDTLLELYRATGAR